MSLWWLFIPLLFERLLELWIAERNKRLLMSRGGQEFFCDTYKFLVAMHLLFFVSLTIESFPWRIPLDSVTIVSLIAILLLQLGRYWCILSLGVFWNTRIIVLPGAGVIRRGPYRLLRHPNYVVVTFEFALIPLVMRAPITCLVFSVANLLLLKQRIRLEEEALKGQTDYREVFSLG